MEFNDLPQHIRSTMQTVSAIFDAFDFEEEAADAQAAQFTDVLYQSGKVEAAHRTSVLAVRQLEPCDLDILFPHAVKTGVYYIYRDLSCLALGVVLKPQETDVKAAIAAYAIPPPSDEEELLALLNMIEENHPEVYTSLKEEQRKHLH